jgi:16S rRNA (cytidine1402-2'-O)-methyltransferase
MNAGRGAGTLFVVATPIGNLADMTERALRTLREVELVLAEDTRVSGALLRHFGISTAVQSLHAHNERRRTGELLARLEKGGSLALITDAGTPLISDPGFMLVRAAREAGMRVVPVPGASAPIAALSASGLRVDRFSFEGFLPAAASARRQVLEALREEPRTMVFFEAPHRITASLHDMATTFGADRRACLAREMTKLFETIVTDRLAALLALVEADPGQCRGEMVVCVEGAPATEPTLGEGRRVASILARYLSPSRAAAAAAEITGVNRKTIYRQLLADGGGEPGAT